MSPDPLWLLQDNKNTAPCGLDSHLDFFLVCFCDGDKGLESVCELCTTVKNSLTKLSYSM